MAEGHGHWPATGALAEALLHLVFLSLRSEVRAEDGLVKCLETAMVGSEGMHRCTVRDISCQLMGVTIVNVA